MYYVSHFILTSCVCRDVFYTHNNNNNKSNIAPQEILSSVATVHVLKLIMSVCLQMI